MLKRDHLKATRELRKSLSQWQLAESLQYTEVLKLREQLRQKEEKQLRLLTILGDAITAGQIDRPEDWMELHK